MHIKRGMRFLHKHWINPDKSPVVCKVFRVAKGIVWYDFADARKAKSMDDIDGFLANRVGEWI